MDGFNQLGNFAAPQGAPSSTTGGSAPSSAFARPQSNMNAPGAGKGGGQGGMPPWMGALQGGQGFQNPFAGQAGNMQNMGQMGGWNTLFGGMNPGQMMPQMPPQAPQQPNPMQALPQQGVVPQIPQQQAPQAPMPQQMGFDRGNDDGRGGLSFGPMNPLSATSGASLMPQLPQAGPNPNYMQIMQKPQNLMEMGRAGGNMAADRNVPAQGQPNLGRSFGQGLQGGMLNSVRKPG